MSSKNNPVSDLEAWFSSERMKTYSFHSDPDALYLWNTRVTKSFLEDIQHVEVLLRNCVDTAVSPRYGQRWYVHPAIPFDRQAKKSIQKAERRAGIRACLLIVGLCSSMIEVCHNGLDLRSSRMHSGSELNHFCQRMRAVKAARLVIAAAL